MILLSRQESLKLDQSFTSDQLKQLMEKAGAAVFEYLKKNFSKEDSFVILVGPGNNGGDALVVERLLHAARFSKVRSFQMDYLTKVTRADLAGAVVVDGIFGVGLSRPLSKDLQKFIDLLNQTKTKSVVAIDVPTGLDADSGLPLPEAIAADVTLTFSRPKPGFFINEGPQHVGRIQVCDLGISEAAIREFAKEHVLITRTLAKSWLPRRRNVSHKSEGGKSFLFAGSDKYVGAGVMASQACHRVGSGYTYLINEFSLKQKIRHPDFIFLSEDQARSQLSQAQSFCVGPGLGVESAKAVIQLLLNQKCRSVVLDADALTALSEMKVNLPSSWILTPHAGEMGRLIDRQSAWVSAHRFEALKICHEKYGALVMLKGFRSITYDGSRFYINSSGNRALAKSGTGDVLSGFITGFMAQGLDPLKATLLAVFVHGWTADGWVKSGKDHLTLTASDLIASLPTSLAQLRGYKGRS